MDMIWNITATAAFLAALGALVLRWLSFCGAALPAPFSQPLPKRQGAKVEPRELAAVFGAALLFRLAVAFGSLLLYNTLSGGELGLTDLPQLWIRWDATHYVNLAELGYGGYVEDGKNLFLVFYPLYVWLTRLFAQFIPNTALAGMAVSFLSFGGGCVYLYRLAAEEYGKQTARWAVILLSTFPFAFFFGGIMTESLFFLTTTAGLYHIRRHQWGRAGLWGVLAAMTRMHGVLLVGAAVAELGNTTRPLSLKGRERSRALLNMVKTLPLLCLPILGSLVYLALNAHVAGNPFAFTAMQEHWSQGFLWFPKVLAYLGENALTWAKVSTRWELWLPQLMLFPLFALLLWRTWKEHRPMLTLYAFVYFILNYCLSWLLSAGRYLSCAVPSFLFLADALEHKPRTRTALAGGMLLLQMAFLYRYLSWGQVM